MKAIFCSIALFLLVASCQRNKPSVTKNDTKVSQGMDSLYSKVQSEPEPPVAADGLFDDFVYSFMRNQRFQLERIDFPLPNFVDGKIIRFQSMIGSMIACICIRMFIPSYLTAKNQ